MDASRREIFLASIICHLAEYTQTHNPVDLMAASSVMEEDEVRDLFQSLRETALLPLPRQPVPMLEQMFETKYV